MKAAVMPPAAMKTIGIVANGADGLILGCTEIGMLLDQTNVAVPVFDTTLISCETALDLAQSLTNP